MSTASTEPQRSRLVRLLAARPPPEASAMEIDFESQQLPEYKEHFAMLIENLFTGSECQALLASAEGSAAHGWEQAMVNIGRGQQMMNTDVRLCDRILWDDHEVAGKVLDRIMPFLPPEIVTLENKPLIAGRGHVKRQETWRVSRLNERLRFLRYTKGMYFRPHCDGTYVTPDRKEMTFMTVHLYLNGDEAPSAAQWGAEKDQDKPLLGGATRFFDWQCDKFLDVNPKIGSVLVFQHRGLMHSGDEVKQGTKYTMRSDILYQKVSS